jgi:hypothetical protein
MSKNMNDVVLVILTIAINAAILYIAGVTNGDAATNEMTAIGAISLSVLLFIFLAPIIGAEAVIIDGIITFFRKPKKTETLL